MPERILPKAKSFIEEIAENNSVYIDATCGNGHDTKFLAALSGTKHVYSFDIQQTAISQAKENTKDFDNITFIKDSHAEVSKYVDVPVKGAMYNLGYLPKGDKSITTTPESTIRSLHQIFNLLEVSGRIIIVVYHGHPEGKVEKDALFNVLSTWPQYVAQVLEYRFINQQNNAPFILCIEKLKDMPLKNESDSNV